MESLFSKEERNIFNITSAIYLIYTEGNLSANLGIKLSYFCGTLVRISMVSDYTKIYMEEKRILHRSAENIFIITYLHL